MLNLSCYALSFDSESIKEYESFLQKDSKELKRLNDTLYDLDPSKENNSGIGLMKRGTSMMKLVKMESQFSDLIHQHSKIRIPVEKIILDKNPALLMLDGKMYYCFLEVDGVYYDVKVKKILKDMN